MPVDCEQFLEFYAGTGSDHRGRGIEQLLLLSTSAMESTHDYIQWLFPLIERSSVSMHAPVLDEACCRAIGTDPVLRATMLRAFDKMLGFYGL